MRQIAEPLRRMDLETVRSQVRAVAGGRALSGRRPAGLATRRVSDLVHVNRVEGVTLGAGVSARPGAIWDVRALGSVGLADERVKARIDAARVGRSGPWLAAFREVRDVSDWPIGSRLVNSFDAQERGRDRGDYYLAQGGRIGYRHPLGVRWDLSVGVGWERIDSLVTRATPATGRYRPNPALGAGGLAVGGVELRRASGGFGIRRDAAFTLALEAGRVEGADPYARVAADGRIAVPVAATTLALRAAAGLATAELPPHRSFVLGGRGTLLGDDFRSWGGRRGGVVHAEWRVALPAPDLPLGPAARVPGQVVLAPFAAAGWAGGAVAGAPWRPAAGTRVTFGAGLEWLGLVRFEAGYGVQSRRVRFAVDVTRPLWDVL